MTVLRHGPNGTRIRAVDAETLQRRAAAYADFQGFLLAAIRRSTGGQRGLARRAGVDHSAISRLARSKREPSLATARKLIEAVIL